MFTASQFEVERRGYHSPGRLDLRASAEQNLCASAREVSPATAFFAKSDPRTSLDIKIVSGSSEFLKGDESPFGGCADLGVDVGVFVWLGIGDAVGVEVGVKVRVDVGDAVGVGVA